MPTTVLLPTPPEGLTLRRPIPGPLTTPDAVGRVSAVSDPVRRNLLITQSYHELAAGKRLVYARLASIYARFLELLSSHREPDPVRLGGFLAELRRSPDVGDARSDGDIGGRL